MTSSNTSEIARLISPDAIASLRASIEEYDGDEVFFIGKANDIGIVESVEASAYGNNEAVPVIRQLIRPGNILIHNHPSGNLQPSSADIAIASEFGNMGVGSYIIDNAVEKIRIVVPAIAPTKKKPLNIAQLEHLFSPEGTFAVSMNQYEERPQQLQMLKTVADSFNEDGIAVIEAGTGTGKSLAYLIPAAFWAKANGEVIVVSTNTINLQEQLISKDIPFLQKHLGFEFTAELMKGRGNYLCKRRMAYLGKTPDFFDDERSEAQIRAIVEWSQKTRDGSLSGLSFIPDSDVWDRVACDGDNCAKIKCPHYATCFFFEARRRASRANIIVANHHLVMADLALKQMKGNFNAMAVLPSFKRIVFDEAHNVEEVATQYFGFNITRRSLSVILSRLIHREKQNFGLLPFLFNTLRKIDFQRPSEHTAAAMRTIADTLVPLRHQLVQSVAEFMDLCAEGTTKALGENPQSRKELQLRITPSVEKTPFWSRTLREGIDEVVDQIGEMVKGMRAVYSACTKLPEEARKELDTPAGELKSLANKLDVKIDQFRNFYTISENRCRWIEIGRHRADAPPTVRLVSLPLEIQEDLNKSVFQQNPTVVLTSATLSVEKKFQFFLSQIGLDKKNAQPDVIKRIQSLHLETPFNYERQAFVGVPLDMPDPGEKGFAEAATNFLLPALQISHGSAFLLFTSYSQLNRFYEILSPVLRPMGYACLRQGTENRQQLLTRFKNDRTSILFATLSFWEGVDVPGDALKMLVLVKLPFKVPTDPLLQSRVEQYDKQGIDSFSEYIVPQAVIKFKQGFGRLIRTRSDFGAVLILDRRVVTKRYGEVFLNSLPTDTIHQDQSLDLLTNLTTFFREWGQQ